MSLDEREAMHQTHPTDPEDGSFFFDPELEVAEIAGVFEASVPGADGREPVGANQLSTAGGGRHARHAARKPESDFSPYPVAGSTVTATLLHTPPRRSLEREGRRRRRRRALLFVIALIVVLVIAGAGWVGYQALKPTKIADWTGAGTGSVVISVKDGDGAQAIGATLASKGVVASTAAFTRAAAKNSQVAGLAAGAYQMRLHMSAAAAISLLVDPATHLIAKVTVTEGNIELNVITKLAAALKVSESAVAAAAANIANLGLPGGYAPATGGSLTSAEGFLYPDTYSFDPGSTPAAALQAMATEFTSEDHTIGFADGAKQLGVSPYQALIIASIAQAEVKFASDVPMVVRVILNRLAINRPLQIDATSVYGAEIAGLDPTKVQFDTLDSPYNGYLHAGLPPTPIGNPGEEVLKETITSVAGNWLYYVNGDAAGHLYFTNDPNDFETHVQACRTNNWGC